MLSPIEEKKDENTGGREKKADMYLWPRFAQTAAERAT